LIVTLTINPALDRNVSADRLVFEDRAYILDTSLSAGGRGINASRVIHSFGGNTLAIATAGGVTGAKFEGLLSDSGFPVKVVPISHETRTNLTISDKQGLTVKLNELGPKIEPTELHAITAAVESNLEGAKWLMICGSLPPGVAPHFYSDLIQLAHKRKVQTLLDTDGDALLHGLEAGPTIVTPNQQEAEHLLNRALITRTHFFDAVDRIQAMGSESVILSLGSRGVVARNSEGMIEAIPPRIDAVCPIGAGDAMAAAYQWAMDKNSDFRDAVRWSVAAGTASAKLPGLAFANLEQTREVYKRVEVRDVPRP
jgi:1-phosphofructokinase family hexose kinase